VPITITLPGPGSAFGPGSFINASTTHVFGDPGSAEWEIAIKRSNELVYTVFAIKQIDQLHWIWQGELGQGTYVRQPDQRDLKLDDPINMTLEVSDGGVVVESANVDLTWNGEAFLGQQAYELALQAQTPVQGGFTAQDRAVLQTTSDRTTLLGEIGDLVVQTTSGPLSTTLAQIFSRQSFDRLTLDEVTDGPTCDPVRANLALWYTGVIVRVTTIAPDLVAKTPDASWYFPDLAVLRVFRGGDLIYRRGIHEPTFMVENPWQFGWNFLNQTQILGVPPQTSIAVDWREGCCGQVFLQFLP
jgi:hypothetical protein